MKNLTKIIALGFSLVLAAQAAVAQPVVKKNNYVSGSFAFGRTSMKGSIQGNQKNEFTNDETPINLFNNKKRNTLGGALAFGGYLSDQVRGELSLEMSQHKFNYFGEEHIGGFTLRHTNYRAMLNAYLDLGTFDAFTPYIMAGAGFGKNMLHTKRLPGGVKLKGKGSFAWQVGAGFDVALNEDVKIGLGYRYLQLDTNKHKKNAQFVYRNEDNDKMDVNVGVNYKVRPVHLGLVTLTYSF